MYSEGLPSDRVVFADELGEWMIPTDFRAIVDRYVELIPEVHSGSDMLVAFDPVSHKFSIPERVDFFLEHDFRDEAATTARRARGRHITEVLDVLKAHGETKLALILHLATESRLKRHRLAKETSRFGRRCGWPHRAPVRCSRRRSKWMDLGPNAEIGAGLGLADELADKHNNE